jgi:hypothetical protein
MSRHEQAIRDAANRLARTITSSQHVYEVRLRKDHRGVDLVSDALPFGRLWYGEPDAISPRERLRSTDQNYTSKMLDSVDSLLSIRTPKPTGR